MPFLQEQEVRLASRPVSSKGAGIAESLVQLGQQLTATESDLLRFAAVVSKSEDEKRRAT